MIAQLNVLGANWTALLLALTLQGTLLGLLALGLVRWIARPQDRSLLLLAALASFCLPLGWLLARVAPPPVSVVLQGDPAQPGYHWPALVLIVHALGMAVCGVRLAREASRLAQLRGSAAIAGVEAEATTVARTLALARVPPVLTADIPVPFVTGALAPAVVLPRGLTQRLTPAQLLQVLHHELAHVRQHDVWINWLVALTRVCFWFHPLPTLLGQRLREAREECCDDAVLACDPQAAGAYARTLVLVAEVAAGCAPPRIAPAMAGHEIETLSRRIRRILQPPALALPSRIRRLGLGLACVSLLGTGAWLTPGVLALPRTPIAAGVAVQPGSPHAAPHAARHAARHPH